MLLEKTTYVLAYAGLVAAGIGAFAASAQAVPTNITVLNNSFQQPDIATPTGFQGCPITNWNCNPNTSSLGVYIPSAAWYPGVSNGIGGSTTIDGVQVAAPDGNQVAYIASNGGFIWQNTAATILANTTYELKLWIGDRGDFPGFPGGTFALTYSNNVATLGTVIGSTIITNPFAPAHRTASGGSRPSASPPRKATRSSDRFWVSSSRPAPAPPRSISTLSA